MVESSERTDVAADRRARKCQQIVEAAARIFAEHGYDDTEMDRVAAALGIAKGTLYLYFPGKKELFFACVDEGMREMQAAVSAERDADRDPFERVSRAIRAYLTFYDEHPHFVELLIQERAIFKHRKKPTYFEYRDANRGPWRELYTNLRDAGRIRADIPIDQMLDMIGNLLYGTMFTNHFTGRTSSIDDQHRVLLAVLLEGILSDAERTQSSRPHFPQSK